jgi:hypothetical protein
MRVAGGAPLAAGVYGAQPIVAEQVVFALLSDRQCAAPHWESFTHAVAQNWLSFPSVKQQYGAEHVVRRPWHPWYAAPSFGTQMNGPIGFPDVSTFGAHAPVEQSAAVSHRWRPPRSGVQPDEPSANSVQTGVAPGHSEFRLQATAQLMFPAPSS